MSKPRVNIFWFRRDLRLEDNAGLYHALKDHNPVVPIFIFDRNILDELEDRKDRRVQFIHEALMALNAQLGKLGSTIFVKHGFPGEVFSSLLDEYDVEKVFTNHDYEPYARDRDLQISKLLETKSISFHTYKDQVIMEKSEVVKENNTPYTVFTPYSNRWKATATDFYFDSYPVKKLPCKFF